MTNEKSPEQMAEEYAVEVVPDPDGFLGHEKDLASAGFLAGFQKNDETVAQPLREDVKCRTEHLNDFAAKNAALTAEVEKLKEENSRLKSQLCQFLGDA